MDADAALCYVPLQILLLLLNFLNDHVFSLRAENLSVLGPFSPLQSHLQALEWSVLDITFDLASGLSMDASAGFSLTMMGVLLP